MVVFTRYHFLQSCYRIEGRYDEAEELFKRALAGKEEKLGAKHPDTLGTVRNLVVFLRSRIDQLRQAFSKPGSSLFNDLRVCAAMLLSLRPISASSYPM